MMSNELRTLFDYLNANCKYIVLRNWDNLFEGVIYSKGHEDIDILCECLEQFISLTKAKRVHSERNRDNFIVTWKSTDIRFDVRWVGDGYYPKELEKIMLENRVFDQRGIFIPNPKDHYYSLAYHALIQKPKLSDEYKQRLCFLRQGFQEASITNVETVIKEDLEVYLASNRWQVDYPNDPGVFLNRRVMNQLPVKSHFIRRIRRALFLTKRTLIGYFKRFMSLFSVG